MKLVATVFLVTVLALIAAACGAAKPTQAPTPTATPVRTLTPTATPFKTLTPQEAAAIADNINSVIDIARTRMAALRTAHMSVDVPQQNLKLEFDVRFPYEVRGVMTESGDPEEVGLLLTKGKAFTGDPNGSCWSERSIPFAIVAVFGLNVISPILQAQLDLADSIRNLEQAPDETAEAFYHFRFDIDWPLWFTLWVQGLDQATGEETANAMYPPENREAMLSGGLQGTAYKGEAWIDKETLLVHRFLWKQISTTTGLPQYTWTVTVSRFDQAVPEVPEVEAIMAVGPCGPTPPTPTPAPETASITLDLDRAEYSGLEVIRITYDAYSPEGAVITRVVSRSGDQEQLLTVNVRREGPFSVSGTHDWPVTDPGTYHITSSVYDWPTFEASLGKDYLEANPTLFTHGVPPPDLLERILASGIRPVASASSSILVEERADATPTPTPTGPVLEPAACLVNQGAPSDVGVDQRNEAPWDGASTKIAPENGAGQSFVPVKSLLVAVAVEITRGSRDVGADTITMKIIGEGEAILVSSSIYVCESFQGWLRFDMPQQGVTVDAGKPLIIRLEDTGKGGFGLKYGGVMYPSGSRVFFGSPQDGDFFFRTYWSRD